VKGNVGERRLQLAWLADLAGCRIQKAHLPADETTVR
jgi:hypothetical protein